MKIPCIYRVGLQGAIVLSDFDFDTGTVSGVPKELLYYPPSKELREVFSDVKTDIVRSSVTSMNLRNAITHYPDVALILADGQNHIYVITKYSCAMRSPDFTDDEVNSMFNESTPVLFDVERNNIGFFRQPVVSYDDYAKTQYFNIFTLSDGTKVYNDGVQFKTVDFEYDEVTNFDAIKLVRLARNPDARVIGVTTNKGQETYLYTDRRLKL